MDYSRVLANAVFSADDTIKVLILLLAGLGLLGLARWASSLGDTHPPVPSNQPTYDPIPVDDPIIHNAPPSSTVPNPGGPLYSFPPDPSLGAIRSR